MGRHLVYAYGKKPQVVLTGGLLVGTDGVEKMSKSTGNHVGINEAPDEIFGKTMSVSDETMAKWYELLTPEPLNAADPNGAKKRLAWLMTERFASREAADDTLAWWNAGRPPRNLETATVEAGPLYAVLTAAGLADSNGDARRKIQQGGVSIDDQKKTTPGELIAAGSYLVRVGKKTSKQVIVR